MSDIKCSLYRHARSTVEDIDTLVFRGSQYENATLAGSKQTMMRHISSTLDVFWLGMRDLLVAEAYSTTTCPLITPDRSSVSTLDLSTRPLTWRENFEYTPHMPRKATR